MYDLIGDVHGYANELVGLLEGLGYRYERGVYRHAERRVIFLGDFIDRGPEILRVLEIVRGMVESGAALSVMGNHELNALAYHTPFPGRPGEFLRPHSEKNKHQHGATLEQLSDSEMERALGWFRTLPLWLELEGLRVVHACWDGGYLRQIQEGLARHGGVSDGFLFEACVEGERLFKPVEGVLKGKEIPLPAGMSLSSADQVVRHEMRVRWYQSPERKTYRAYAMSAEVECDELIDCSGLVDVAPYPAMEKPVFIGHYWLRGDQPELLAPNVACLDFSVAKGGYLCAYRWDGEQVLRNEKFVRFL